MNINKFRKKTKSLQLQEKYQISGDGKIQPDSRRNQKSTTSGKISGEKKSSTVSWKNFQIRKIFGEKYGIP